ncbi:MAG TPA: type I DNA topoisomerase [Phycisphaerae bacterium]|nr:type I DNA topoisomerase [Phycisphaerae bacterium]
MAKKKTSSKASGGTARAAARSLVIVESPAKAKTINKYLGSDYVVKASKGHVRDLPPHAYGIDPAKNFEPTYEILPDHSKIVSELRKYSDDAETVYLATDLDREGEAIAWHLKHALDLPDNKVRRVVFNEITKTAIRNAFDNPHEIDVDKVDAQQARRILDRIVGYELSPLLWKKISKGLSAGRVQSVAVRLIVIREHEIRAFEPQEYWAIDGAFTDDAGAATSLAGDWRKFCETGGKDGGAPSQKERYAWLSKNGGFEAAMSELAGNSFKPEGRLDTSRPKGEMFTSAADEVRQTAEALGVKIEDTQVTAWDEYRRFGLTKVEFVRAMSHDDAPEFKVRSIETRRTTSKPNAPFTTATLQQAGANVLRFSTSRTMRVAQGLYEGVDIKSGEGNVGLITYMRTDSKNLSNDSINAVRGWLADELGEKYLPEKPNRYASGKAAQEAHEAIRPTDVTRTPESLRGHLTDEQHKLYTLIWNRFVACQMTPAQWDATTVMIHAPTSQGDVAFKLSGRTLVFDGFYRVMGVPKSGDDQNLPELKEGQRVYPIDIAPTQKFTSPPARYTEASLVKTLEAEGIGRPSTYANIIKTIQDRGYVAQEDRKFHPTQRGEVVTEKLVDHFPKIMDIQFTRFVEEELDKIEESHLDWRHVLHEFYDPFKESLARAHEDMEKVRAEPSEYTCEQCGKQMVYRLSKNGRFLSCSGYPECKNAKNIDKDGKPVEPIVGAEACEKCGRDMVVRKSRMGFFLGCSGYPECDATKPCMEDGTPLRKVEASSLKQKCAECGAEMEVKWARGKAFLGCTGYPKCKATEQLPDDVYVEKPRPEEAGVRCDKCGRNIVIRKSRRGPFLSCSGFPKCRNAMPMDKLDHLKELEKEGKIPEPPPEPAPGAKGKAKAGGRKNLTKEEIAALGPPPEGFVWTRTGRPTVEVLPENGVLTCFECGGEMRMRTGRFGPFFACGSPKCKAAANLRGDAKKQAEAESPEANAKPIETDQVCPDCGKPMLLRLGNRGRFLACSGYPECKKTMEPPAGLLREVAAAGAAG